MANHPPRYIVWAPSGEPTALPSSSALVRWAQARRLTSLEVWVVLAPAQQIVRASMSRQDRLWAIRYEDEVVTIPADPSDDTRTLQAVSLLSEADNQTLSLVRYSLAEWPPVGPRVGALLGSMPPILVDDQWEWHYCPDWIAELTRDLSDTEFWVYLQSVDLRANLAIVHRHLSEYELETLLDDMLHEKMPPTHINMLMKVRWRAITQTPPWENR